MAALVSSNQSYVQVDEEGYFKLNDARVTDDAMGADWLAKIRIDEHRRAVLRFSPNEPETIVEAFDEPYVAVSIRPSSARASWVAQMPYGYREAFKLNSLTVDEWDRFHGRTERGVPFVLSRAAQAAFFNIVDDYDDDGATVAGERFEISPWLAPNLAMDQSSYWSTIYQNETPRWEMDAPSPVITAATPRLKLAKSRVLVLGAGSGSDAAFFAELGHSVTAVDFSAEAIAQARERHGARAGLRFEQADVFNLPDSMTNAFDLVIEHTCYCAINPSRRDELVKVWRRCLADRGHLMGVFFTIDKRDGPPFGASEWELRSRLAKSFRSLYWMRARNSFAKRAGQETFIYAQKLSQFD